MNWLIKNRRGANWSNTRDTAIVVLAMNDYLKTSGELKGGIKYELQVNGKTIKTQKVRHCQFNPGSDFLPKHSFSRPDRGGFGDRVCHQAIGHGSQRL
jgi:hypothetical protein